MIPQKIINSWCWTVVFPIPTDLIELKTIRYIQLSVAPSSGKYYDILINNNSGQHNLKGLSPTSDLFVAGD